MSNSPSRWNVDATDVDRSDVARMVDAIAPDWRVERVRPSDEGSTDVFFLTVGTPDGPREVVLKTCSGDAVTDTVARSEPRFLKLLASETEIPIPETFGFVDEHPDLPAPFFLAERLPNESGAGRFDDLTTPALERLIADAGRHLAELHDVRSLDRFGQIGVEAGELAVVDDGCGRRDRWTDWLLADVEETLDGLEGSRFDDLVSPLRDHLRDAIPALGAPDESALIHWDYRLGNLLIDLETGETTGVLDWADLLTGDPVYNLVTVEDHNVNWQTRDVVLRRRLRDRFFAAYDSHRSGERPADFRDRKRVYHLCHRLNAMACLPDWYANADGAVRDERAAEHRLFVRDYLG